MPMFVNINKNEDSALWINISEIVAVMQSEAHTRVTCRGDEGMVYLGTLDCKTIMHAITAMVEEVPPFFPCREDV